MQVPPKNLGSLSESMISRRVSWYELPITYILSRVFSLRKLFSIDQTPLNANGALIISIFSSISG